MKNRFLSFLKKYYCLVIFSLLHPLAMATADIWGGIEIRGMSAGYFGHPYTYDFYCIFLAPILHFIHGCITYVLTKRAFIPNAIVAVVYSVYFGIMFFDNSFYPFLLFGLIPIAFSLLGSLITAGLHKTYTFIIRQKKSE